MEETILDDILNDRIPITQESIILALDYLNSEINKLEKEKNNG
jgi:hypothetical protein